MSLSRRIGLIPILFFCMMTMQAQDNCLIYPADSGERIACELSYRAVEYPQGSKDSQILFDAAIEIGPNYAWAYYEKSVPYFKRGLLSEGLEILNYAIQIDPAAYLYYRAYWYFQHRSYEACIRDLEELYQTHKAGITYTPGGDMEMRLLLAMAYVQVGERQKGLQATLDCIESYEGKEYLIGEHDYHLLGLMYLVNDDLESASQAFLKQQEVNGRLADSYYYLGSIRKAEGKTEAAQRLFRECVEKLDGQDGGYSSRSFIGFEIEKEMVEKELASLSGEARF